MPEVPDDADDQRGRQRLPALEQRRQEQAAPADLLAERPVHDREEDEHDRQLRERNRARSERSDGAREARSQECDEGRVTLALADKGLATKAGDAIISGTLTCDRPVASLQNITVTLRQRFARVVIAGDIGPQSVVSAGCGLQATPWSITIHSSNGLFGGGQATATASMTFADWAYGTRAPQTVTETVQLSKAKK